MIELENETELNWYFNELLKQGLILRSLKNFGWPKSLRISVGTKEELDFFEEKLRKLKP